MMMRWVVDCKDIPRGDRTMYRDELRDLEMMYKETMLELHKKVEEVLPPLLQYMEEFVALHKKNESICEKLDVLLAKAGREGKEDE